MDETGNPCCITENTSCCSKQTCSAGYYACNNETSCCPIGSDITPPPTPGGPPGNDDTDGGGTSCNETAPTGMSTTRTSPTSAILNWTPGAHGTYQALWVSTDPVNPQTGCAGSLLGDTSACPVRADSSMLPLPSNESSYFIDNLLAPGTVYYWEIMNFKANHCYKTKSATFISSCDLLPSSLTMSQGTSQTIASTISSGDGIQNVAFSSDKPTYLSVNPASDTTCPYQTLLTALLQGSATVTSNAYLTDGTLGCSADSAITISPPLPWWQVKDSDVSTNGSLNSAVPKGKYFDIVGDGGYPGIPAYGDTTNLTSTNVSATHWLANSGYSGIKTYDSSFFLNAIPSDTTINQITSSPIDTTFLNSGVVSLDGYYWYAYDGSSIPDLNINGNVSLTNKKVILIAKGANIIINGDITLTDGSGFFLAIAGKDADGNNGNITISPTVGGGTSTSPNLEGIFVADNQFYTGGGDTQLYIKGTVVAYGGSNLQRDLGTTENATTPSEVFEYSPALELLFPSKLSARNMSWREVAP